MNLMKLIILCWLCSGCTEVKPDSSKNIKENQKDSTHEINMIFGEAKTENMTYYNSAGAEYVIFKII